ncbi:hypothetical protein ABZ568_11380 [Streptomyces olindensis]|uniref:Uncharacterized protein n=1 Tax=Streptomyces olindensis TaxID=358823 RepID=A0ABV2XSN6_9ACTN
MGRAVARGPSDEPGWFALGLVSYFACSYRRSELAGHRPEQGD